MIVEVNHNIMTSNLDLEFKKIAKYYVRFEKHSIIFLITKHDDINKLINFDQHEVIINKHQLNEVARSRIITNMIYHFPELVIPVLDRSINSFLIKIRKKNA